MNKFMWFIHHFIIIWLSILWSSLYWFVSLMMLLFSKKARNRYKRRKNLFSKKMDIFTFLEKLKKEKMYVNDSVKKFSKWVPIWLQGIINGIMQHYNTKLEIYVRGMDCDSFPKFIKWYIKKHYKGINVTIFGILGKDLSTWHYDCYFIYDGKLIIANQGYCLFVADVNVWKKSYSSYMDNDLRFLALLRFIQSDKYMHGWYKELKAIWKCCW